MSQNSRDCIPPMPSERNVYYGAPSSSSTSSALFTPSWILSLISGDAMFTHPAHIHQIRTQILNPRTMSNSPHTWKNYADGSTLFAMSNRCSSQNWCHLMSMKPRPLVMAAAIASMGTSGILGMAISPPVLYRITKSSSGQARRGNGGVLDVLSQLAQRDKRLWTNHRPSSTIAGQTLSRCGTIRSFDRSCEDEK